jgi:hypothetical protein
MLPENNEKRGLEIPPWQLCRRHNRSPALSAGGFDSSRLPVDSREPDKEPGEQPTQPRCPMPTAASKDHPSWTIAAHLESLLFSPRRLRPSVFSNSYLSFVLYFVTRYLADGRKSAPLSLGPGPFKSNELHTKLNMA